MLSRSVFGSGRRAGPRALAVAGLVGAFSLGAAAAAVAQPPDARPQRQPSDRATALNWPTPEQALLGTSGRLTFSVMRLERYDQRITGETALRGGAGGLRAPAAAGSAIERAHVCGEMALLHRHITTHP